MEMEHVAPQAADRRNSARTAGGVRPHLIAAEAAICYWNDKKYSDGATVCDSGRRYECWNGKWAELGDC